MTIFQKIEIGNICKFICISQDIKTGKDSEKKTDQYPSQPSYKKP